MSCLVSILIPVYNRESIIAETIQSALDQTYQNIEIIIVDNASNDNTWSVIEGYAKQDCRIKAFRNETNLGPVRNWLRCVEEASGEYGKILWSDDLIAPEFIEKTLPLFNDDVGFVFTVTRVFCRTPDNGRDFFKIGANGLYGVNKYINRSLYDRGVPASPGCAIFRMSDIRKNLLVEIPNKVNSDFAMHAIGNDMLLFLLTANDYKYFGFVSEPLSFFRHHEGSISISSTPGKLPLHYALAKAYFVENYKPSDVKCLSSLIQYLLWRYKDSGQYGMNSVNDFFYKSAGLSYICLVKRLLLIPLYATRKLLIKYF